MRNPFNWSKAFMALFTATTLIISSCATEDEKDTDPNKSSQVEQTDDSNITSEATDDISDEASMAFLNEFGARTSGSVFTICNANTTVDNANKKIVISYNGDNCEGTRTRSGMVTVKLIPATTDGEWSDEGSKLLITYSEVKITRKSDSKYITINGTQKVTNTSGGNLVFIPDNGLVHTIRANMTIKFGASTNVRSWWAAKKKTLKKDWSKLTIQADSTNSMAEGGVNRSGQDFISKITTNVEIDNCGTLEEPKWIATKGVIEHVVGAVTVTAKFGYKLGADNMPVESFNCEAKGMYVMWNAASKTNTAFVTY